MTSQTFEQKNKQTQTQIQPFSGLENVNTLQPSSTPAKLLETH